MTALERQVKGVLFADYVRMIRGNKHVDWSRSLGAEDLTIVHTRVADDGWYPMACFERLGNAILEHVALRNLDAVRMWGRFSVDKLRAAQPTLVAPGDPVESLRRFGVLRASYFDFEALTVVTLTDGHAELEIRYHMGALAEMAASYQTMGFFERLLDAAGALDVAARLAEQSWAGDPRTLLAIDWRQRNKLLQP